MLGGCGTAQHWAIAAVSLVFRLEPAAAQDPTAISGHTLHRAGAHRLGACERERVGGIVVREVLARLAAHGAYELEVGGELLLRVAAKRYLLSRARPGKRAQKADLLQAEQERRSRGTGQHHGGARRLRRVVLGGLRNAISMHRITSAGLAGNKTIQKKSHQMHAPQGRVRWYHIYQGLVGADTE
eukprot:COSAG01_NODE_4173_length_5269_cov_7.276015_2_plen_185_part_00